MHSFASCADAPSVDSPARVAAGERQDAEGRLVECLQSVASHQKPYVSGAFHKSCLLKQTLAPALTATSAGMLDAARGAPATIWTAAMLGGSPGLWVSSSLRPCQRHGPTLHLDRSVS